MSVSAKTWLFVPGDRPERFAKATAAGAGAVIIDLEDAVSPEHKPAARAEAVHWLHGRHQAWVRINDATTTEFSLDLAAVQGAPGLLGVIVPKAEDPDRLQTISSELSAKPVFALIETALGWHRVHQIAQTPGVARLGLGSIDLAVDLGIDHSDEVLLPARSAVVLASRVAGLPAPVDGVSTEIRDSGAVEAAARTSRRLGFGGKLCIHPRQVAATDRGLSFSDEEIAWAREVLEAADGTATAAVMVDGRMVDKPVLDHARRILGRDKP